ncbi:MAG TPA: hypothetical protein VFX50_09520 [Gemmatimonadales bacterium]|nr:hypothetical protein [Gemmatimonadales bacterium]
MLRRGERGLALLAAVLALAFVDALLCALWLWSRAEAREASESLAASRAAWLAAAAESAALAWLAAREAPLAADTALAPFAGGGADVGTARIAVHGAGLAELVVRGTATGSPGVRAERVRCRWLVRQAPDSAGVSRYLALGVGGAGGCP